MLFRGGFRVYVEVCAHPITVFIAQLLNLSVRSVKVSQDFHDFSFDLKFRLFGHQGCEWGSPEIPWDFNFVVLSFANTRFHCFDLVVEHVDLEILVLVRVSKVKARVKVFDDWSKKVTESFVSLVICSHHPDFTIRVLNSALNADLNIASSRRGFFLHVWPNLPSKMFFQERVTLWPKLGVSDNGYSLRNRASNFDAMLIKLLLCHKVWKVLDLNSNRNKKLIDKNTHHENDGARVSRMNQRV